MNEVRLSGDNLTLIMIAEKDGSMTVRNQSWPENKKLFPGQRIECFMLGGRIEVQQTGSPKPVTRDDIIVFLNGVLDREHVRPEDVYFLFKLFGREPS